MRRDRQEIRHVGPQRRRSFPSTSNPNMHSLRGCTRRLGALHLLHVLDDAFALPGTEERSLPAAERLQRDQARERLNDLLTADDREAGAHLAVMSPSPATAIVAYAEQVQASAMVMGTHGRLDKPMGSAIGSVAELARPHGIVPRDGHAAAPTEALTQSVRVEGRGETRRVARRRLPLRLSVLKEGHPCIPQIFVTFRGPASGDIRGRRRTAHPERIARR